MALTFGANGVLKLYTSSHMVAKKIHEQHIYPVKNIKLKVTCYLVVYVCVPQSFFLLRL